MTSTDATNSATNEGKNKATNEAPSAAATMRAAVFHRFGGPEVVHIERVAKPIPGADEVLVRVRAAQVSVADHRLRSRDIPPGLSLMVAPVIGLFRPRKRILGMDASGIVEAVGADVVEWKPGDEVIFERGQRMGCHAEYVTARAGGSIVRKPASLSFEDAAALLFGGPTAQSFLAKVDMHEGSEVLVNGASGSVGTSVIQLAKLRGAVVTAVCSGRNAELVRDLGADRVIDYNNADFAEDAARYDVIVECVGNAPFRRVQHLLKPGGALLLVILDLRGMLSAGWQSRRSGAHVATSGARVDSGTLAELARLAEAGDLRPVVDRAFEFDDIVEAHRYVDTGRKRGNVIVRVS